MNFKMNDRIRLLIFLGLITADLFNVSAQSPAQNPDGFAPSGKPLFVLFSDVHTTFSDSKHLTAFEVNRGFLGYEYSFSKNFSGRIVYDATAQSVNGKTLMEGYLRNAYLQFDNGIILIRGGLINSEHMMVADRLWGYRYVAKSLIDISGMIYSADLGISVKYTPSEVASLDFSVTNGRGYKDLAADSTFRYSTGVTINPLKGLTLRGFVDFMPEKNATQWTSAFICDYTSKRFSLGAEYDFQKNHSNIKEHDYSGFAVFGAYSVSKSVTLFGRYYEYSSVIPHGDNVAWNSSNDNNTIIAGLDYTPVKGIRISPNLTFINPAEAGSANITIASLNIEVKF